MPDETVGCTQSLELWSHIEAVVIDRDGREWTLPDPCRFWPVLLLNIRRRHWGAVRHNLRHDALRKLLRRY